MPASGQRLWDLISPGQRQALLQASADAFVTAPPTDLIALDPRVLPHPLATYLQPVHYEPGALPDRKTFAWPQAYVGSPFAGIYERLAEEQSWEPLSLPYGA